MIPWWFEIDGKGTKYWNQTCRWFFRHFHDNTPYLEQMIEMDENVRVEINHQLLFHSTNQPYHPNGLKKMDLR